MSKFAYLGAHIEGLAGMFLLLLSLFRREPTCAVVGCAFILDARLKLLADAVGTRGDK